MTLAVRHVARGVAREAGSVVAHVALYPFGLLPAEPWRRMPAGLVRGVQRPTRTGRALLGRVPGGHRSTTATDTTVVTAGTPILLVHGLVDNRAVFTTLQRSLRRRGFTNVVSFNYSLFTMDVPTAAARLDSYIEDLCERTGYEQVHVVAHSMGGLIARYLVQVDGRDQRVHTLVTLGTPHAGTKVAQLFPGRVIRQLRPGSELINLLDQPAPRCSTRFIAVASDLDELMRPTSCARIAHPDLRATNISIRGVGHHALVFDRDVADLIATLLTHSADHPASRDSGQNVMRATEMPSSTVLQR
jgi:triacylglycerol lipase